MAKRRKKIKIGNVIALVFFVCLSVLVVRKLSAQVAEKNKLQEEYNQKLQQKEQLELEKEYLTEQKEKLNDKNYLENIKRTKYLITKEGEQIFKLPASED